MRDLFDSLDNESTGMPLRVLRSRFTATTDANDRTHPHTREHQHDKYNAFHSPLLEHKSLQRGTGVALTWTPLEFVR